LRENIERRLTAANARFRFSRRAEADLDDIAAAYIARDNPARAVSFIQEF
jgi:plasmid stabilization system protein ParE